VEEASLRSHRRKLQGGEKNRRASASLGPRVTLFLESRGTAGTTGCKKAQVRLGKPGIKEEKARRKCFEKKKILFGSAISAALVAGETDLQGRRAFWKRKDAGFFFRREFSCPMSGRGKDQARASKEKAKKQPSEKKEDLQH